MFHLNDRHSSDSSRVPKMAVMHNLPTSEELAHIPGTGSRSQQIKGEIFCKREWKPFVVFLCLSYLWSAYIHSIPIEIPAEYGNWGLK